MEEQNELDAGISTKDIESLKPELCKVEDIQIIDVNLTDSKGRKAVFVSKHPARDDSIKISAVQFIRNAKVTTSGTWISKDEEGKFLKLSALATLMSFYKVETLRELIGKEIQTVLDDKGFLCLKAY